MASLILRLGMIMRILGINTIRTNCSHHYSGPWLLLRAPLQPAISSTFWYTKYIYKVLDTLDANNHVKVSNINVNSNTKY